MHEVVEKVLVSQDEIIDKCAELGEKIKSDYKALNEVTYVVGLLKDKDLDCSVQGLSILLVEDIVDTGRTLKEVKRTLMNKGAKDVKVVSLLDKPDRRVVDIEAEYVGFAIPNEFVIGYGLDYDQKYRNLPYIGVLKREIYE